MAEKIIEINGINGTNPSGNVATAGITSVDFAAFTKSYEKRSNDMKNLITGIANSSVASMTKIESILGNINLTNKTHSLAVISYLGGIQSLIVGYAEQLNDTLFKILKKPEFKTVSEKLQKDTNNNKITVNNPYRDIAQLLIDKMVYDNKSTIQTINLKDILDAIQNKKQTKQPTSKQIVKPIANIGVMLSVSRNIEQLNLLFDLFTDDYANNTKANRTILSGVVKSIEELTTIQYSIHDIVDAINKKSKTNDEQPIVVNTSITNPESKVPLTDNFETTLFNYLQQILDGSKSKTKTTTNVNKDSSIHVNYSGNLSFNELIGMLDNTAIYDPIRIAIFKKSFMSVAKTVADGTAILLASIKGKAETINATTSMLTAIGNLVSERASVDKNLEMFGTRLYQFSKSENPFSKKNANIFKNGFETVANVIASSIERINAIKTNTKRLESIISFVDGISTIIRGEDEQKTFMLFGKKYNKVYAFNKTNANRFSGSFNLIANSLSNGLATIANIKTPTEKKIQSILNSVTSLSTVLDIVNNDTKSKSKKFSLSFKLITTSIQDGFLLINDIKTPTSKKIGDIKNVSNTLLSILDGVQNSILMKSISFRIAISSVVSGIVYASEKIQNIKPISKRQLEVATTIKGLVDNMSAALSLNNFKPKKIDALVSSINRFQLVLTSIGKSEAIITRGANVFCNAIETITQRLNNNDNKQTSKNVKMLAGGMALLGLSLVAFALLSPVILVASAGLLAFGYALKHMSSKKSIRDIAIFTVSLATLGIAIWAFGEIVSVKAIGGTILALASLAGAIWLFSGGGSKYLGIKNVGPAPYKNMLYVALGLAALGGSIWLWQKLGIQGETVLKVIGGVAALAGAAWAYSKVKDVSLLKMIGTAASIGVLGLSVWAWQLMGITTETCVNVAIGAGALALVAIGFDKVQPKSLLLMIGTALSVGIMGLAIYSWQYLGITMNSGLTVAGSIAAIGIASLVYTAISPLTPIAMIGVGIGIAAIGFGVSMFKDVTNEQLLQTGIFVAGIGLTSYLFANPLALMGAASMLVVGLGVAALAFGMKTMVDAGIDNKKTTEFVDSMTTICLGFTMLALPAVPAAVAAALMIPVAASSIIIAGSIAVIGIMTYQPQKMQQFQDTVKTLVDTYDSLGIVSLTKAVAKAVLMVPIAGTTILVGSAISLITLIKYKPDSMLNYSSAVRTLVNLYDSFGIIQLGKTVLKATAILPLTAATFATAIAIRTIQMLDIDSNKLQSNANAMGLFIESMSEVFGKAGEKVMTVRRGVYAVGGLASTIKSLADAVFMIARMEYTENEVRDGKIVPKAIRKLTDKDFELVGVGIAKMLNSLIDPLVTIGSNQDTYTIGGITIQNPFGSGNKVQRGIKALNNIGNIFTPLAATVKAFADSGVLGKDSDDAIKKLNKGIGSLIGGVSFLMQRISTIDVKDAKGVGKIVGSIKIVFEPVLSLLDMITKTGILSDDNKEGAEKLKSTINTIIDSVSSITTKLSSVDNPKNLQIVTKDLSNLFTILAKADANGLKAVREELDLIYKKLVDEKPWKNFTRNIQQYDVSIARIKSSINGVDLQKAIVLKDIAKNLNEANDNDNIERLIVAIQQLVEKVDNNNEAITNQITNTNENQQTIIQKLEPQTKNKKGEPVPQKSEEQQPSQMGKLNSEISKLAAALSRPLTVVQKQGDTWAVETR